jgi:iron(III) transport system ATP-binding protein
LAGADGSVQVGPLLLAPRPDVKAGPVKVAVRPEAWRIDRSGRGLAATLRKLAYLGSFFEYTFDTALGPIFVVSSELAEPLAVGAEVGLSLAGHGVSVVQVS